MVDTRLFLWLAVTHIVNLLKEMISLFGLVYELCYFVNERLETHAFFMTFLCAILKGSEL